MPVARKIILARTDRLHRIPLGHPSELDRVAERLQRRGSRVFDLSRLDRTTTPQVLQDSSTRSVTPWSTAPARSLSALAEGFASWYDHRFSVNLDPKREIVVVPSAPIGLFLLALAFVEPGETAYIPDPGAPFYRGAIVLAGGTVISYSLRERNDYLPSFAGLEDTLFARSKLFVASYPHNPTSALADIPTLNDLVTLARRQQMLICFDAAFTQAEPTGGSPQVNGLLQVPAAKGSSVEIVSLGANFGLPDLSLTAICGNRDAVEAVATLVEAAELTPDEGTVAAAKHLVDNAEDILEKRLSQLELPRRILHNGFSELGWSVKSSANTPFIWITTPRRITSDAFARRILRRTGIKLTPGTTFGELGEGYARAAIPTDPERAKLIVEKLGRYSAIQQRRLRVKRTKQSKRATRESGGEGDRRAENDAA